MISISANNGELIRTIPSLEAPLLFGWHKTFGFISESAAKYRAGNRKKFGLSSRANEWICKFFIIPSKAGAANEIKIEPIFGCDSVSETNGIQILRFADSSFRIQNMPAAIPQLLGHKEEKNQRSTVFLLLFALLIALFFIYLNMETLVERKKEDLPEPLSVTIVKPERVVRLPNSAAIENIRQQTREIQQNRAMQKQVKEKLGFLDLVGNKNLSKIAGGTPTNLKEVSPGAGAGGKEGSGGEMLVGLGQGVKRTTVGNSGVSGLGGIGTKGRGGGEGGYGSVTVSSGPGGGISKGVLGQDVLIEGGLSQSAIQATIAKYLSQVRACYEEGLRKNTGLTGLVTTKFIIGASGDVDSVQTANSSLNNKEVENCIENRAATWKFPKPLGNVKVKFSYPFLLKPLQS